MSNFKMPTAYHPSNVEWVRPIESLTSDGVRELQRLQAENDKLRKLVAEMFNACPMCVNCAHNHLTVGWYDRMRELGVDVL